MAFEPAELLICPAHTPYIFEHKGSVRFSPTVPKIAPSPAFEQEAFGSYKEAGAGRAWKEGPCWLAAGWGPSSLWPQKVRVARGPCSACPAKAQPPGT